MLPGIDVSHYQQTTPPLTGLSFLFARATYDVIADDKYAMHMANAEKAGLVRGAYHFGTGRSPVDKQVSAFLAAVGDVSLFALDLESDAVPMTQDQAAAFIKGVQAAGMGKIGLYHSDSGFPHLGQDFDYVADYGVEPRRPFSFWQYRGSPLDLDYFNGTLDDLYTLAGENVSLVANTKYPAQANVVIPAGTQIYDLAGRGLVKPSSDITVTSVGASGPFDVVIVTTAGVTQYTLVKTADIRSRALVTDPEVMKLQSKIAAARTALA